MQENLTPDLYIAARGYKTIKRRAYRYDLTDYASAYITDTASGTLTSCWQGYVAFELYLNSAFLSCRWSNSISKLLRVFNTLNLNHGWCEEYSA